MDDDASGNEDGSSWPDAFTDLQGGLAGAGSGDQIWVAAGRYVPGAIETDTFQLLNGVEIYGGFEGLSGTEGDFGVRDPETFLTILSGDIEGNDTVGTKGLVTDTSNIVGSNSDHIVTGSGTDNTAVLDGFTINAGQADGSSSFETLGGGMLNNEGSPTLSNLIFFSNAASDEGGGMVNIGGTLQTGPTLTNVVFSRNSAVSGGGMFSCGIDPTLIECTFSENSALNDAGGGMYNTGNNPMLINCTFFGNSALIGGGMSNESGGDPTLINVVFSGNFGNGSGGGMVNRSSFPTLINCTFSGNYACSNGGGMLNLADPDGGGSNPIIQNCVFGGNSAASGNQIFNQGATATITDSLIQGGCPADANCTGTLLTSDPLFVAPDGADNTIGTPDDNPRTSVGFSRHQHGKQRSSPTRRLRLG